MLGGNSRVLLYTKWSEKALLRRQHKDVKRGRKKAMQLQQQGSSRHRRQMEDPELEGCLMSLSP